MTTTVRELAQLLDKAKDQGARASEVLVMSGQGIEVFVERGKVTRKQPVLNDRTLVRVWLEGGREGHAVGKADTVEGLLLAALKAAEKAPEDRFAGPVRKMKGLHSGLGIDDRRHEQLTVADRMDMLISAERTVRNEDRRLLARDFHYNDLRTHRIYVNSREVQLEEWSTTYGVEGTVHFSDDRGEVSLTGGTHGRSFSSVSSLPFGILLARRAVSLLRAGPELSGPVLLVLRPAATAQLFARIAELFTPQGLADSFLADRPQLDARLHLLDDGRLPGGLRTRAFDDRGVPPVVLTLLKEGRPDALFTDPTRARQVDARPTGHCTGSTQAPTNLTLRPGTRSVNALLADGDLEALILDTLPIECLDVSTGVFEGTVHGVMQRGTKVGGAARNVRLRMQLTEALNRVVQVASDTDRVGHVDAPALILEGATAV